jgi:NAD(P)-dependent dehydrogenase (short-subunit alcohol dehydrogenase family)
MPYQSIFGRNLFQGDSAIVAGGGGGFGRCIAHDLSALGARPVAKRQAARHEDCARIFRLSQSATGDEGDSGRRRLDFPTPPSKLLCRQVRPARRGDVQFRLAPKAVASRK